MVIYFDQAASSHPKPEKVTERMIEAITNYSANPGRGAHRLANKAASIVLETRNKVSTLFGCSNPNHCLFYQNATIALNQAIKGLEWIEGDHVITTTFEHNSTRRPLEYLKAEYGVDITYISPSDNEEAFVESIKKEITPLTKLIVMTHASNVTGEVLPVDSIIRLAERNKVLTLLDASQTAGHMQIDMQKQGIDMLVFPGHKGLLGPQGVGMLLIDGEINLKPIHHGGTGSYSEEIDQPAQLPEKLESGTLNTPGIAGLLGALECFEERMEDIVPRETLLTKKLLSGLNKIDSVEIYGPMDKEKRMPIVSFNIKDIPAQEIAMILDSHYDIAVRAGLQCSPLTHEEIGTMEQGVIRVSMNMYNTVEEVQAFLQAIDEIVESYNEV